MTKNDENKLLKALNILSELVQKGLTKYASACGISDDDMVHMTSTFKNLNEKYNGNS